MKHFLLSLFFIALLIPAFGQRSSRYLSDGEELQFYPNPAMDYISLKGQQSVQEVHVYDLLGKRLKTFLAVNNSVFFVGDLNRGTYLVQFIDPKNQVLATRRMNKQ